MDDSKLVVLKLTTGEEVVGERVSGTPDNLRLKNILALEMVQVGPGQLAPTARRWLMTSEKDYEHTFQPEDVYAVVDRPAAFVRDMYRAVISPIALAR